MQPFCRFFTNCPFVSSGMFLYRGRYQRVAALYFPWHNRGWLFWRRRPYAFIIFWKDYLGFLNFELSHTNIIYSYFYISLHLNTAVSQRQVNLKDKSCIKVLTLRSWNLQPPSITLRNMYWYFPLQRILCAENIKQLCQFRRHSMYYWNIPV